MMRGMSKHRGHQAQLWSMHSAIPISTKLTVEYDTYELYSGRCSVETLTKAAHQAHSYQVSARLVTSYETFLG